MLVGSISIVTLGAQTSDLRSSTTASVSSPPDPDAVQEMLATYCYRCHNETRLAGGLALDALDVHSPDENPEPWERVIRKLRTGTMPPGGSSRPGSAEYEMAAEWLEVEIDRAWEAEPNPGEVSPVHRLNRLEYNNAVRDLFAL